MPYIDRLNALDLDPLEVSRIKADLYVAYKFISGKFVLKTQNYFQYPYDNLSRNRNCLILRIPIAKKRL